SPARRFRSRALLCVAAARPSGRWPPMPSAPPPWAQTSWTRSRAAGFWPRGTVRDCWSPPTIAAGRQAPRHSAALPGGETAPELGGPHNLGFEHAGPVLLGSGEDAL